MKSIFYSATHNSGNQRNITCQEKIQQEKTRLEQMYKKKTPGVYQKFEKLGKDIHEVGL